MLLVLAFACLLAAHAHMTEALASSWMWADVKRMLRPQWSVVWSPALHAKFPVDQREKCRLVVFANILALRRTRTRYQPPSRRLHLSRQSQTNHSLNPSTSIGGFMWTLLDAFGVTEGPFGDGDDEHEALLVQDDSGDGRLQPAVPANTSSSQLQVQWLYLPQPVVHHILELAMYLW